MVKIETEDCKEWVREPFVVDVWMDSGVAWIASVDGLRNKELFNRLYPYDWVTEAIDQTRGVGFTRCLSRQYYGWAGRPISPY